MRPALRRRRCVSSRDGATRGDRAPFGDLTLTYRAEVARFRPYANENASHLAVLDLSTTTTLLAQRGFKLTRQRRAVLGVVAASRARLSPAELHEQARRLCPDLGLATVYRTLDILDSLGLVRRVHMNDHCEGFAPVVEGEGHHVVCVKCGRVEEFSGCNVSALIPAAARQTGFHIQEHFLELMGTCADCHRKDAAAERQDA
jgi:Fur family transcriptional regulator, ferric uptake regulator